MNLGTLINVCGTGYCGSTMLDLMLGNDGNVFSCGEVNALFRPWRKYHKYIECSCMQNPCPIWNQLKKVPEEEFYTQIIRLMNVDYIVDSSKHLTWIIDANKWAYMSGLKVFNIVIWKSPIDLAYSFWKRGIGIDLRRQFTSYFSRFFELNYPFVAVNYNDLISNTNEKLSKICNYVGLNYFEGKERFWEGEHHYIFGSGGVRKQVREGRSELKLTKYTREFELIRDNIQCKIDSDPKIRSIVIKLLDADISNYQPDNYSMKGADNFIKPIWYYSQKVKRKVKKLISEIR